LPGPVATLHLADLGAEVIKIEDPQIGDYARTLGTGSGEDSAYFRMINRNKQGMVLDLKKPEAVEVSCAWRPRPMSSSKASVPVWWTNWASATRRSGR
jgi:crotonobetainyl-CoA:carnitine CoA-transferase CaiB-like acyl-CoA transferase